MYFFTNMTTLVHEMYTFVGKYIMEQYDVDLCYSFILKHDLLTISMSEM